MLKKFKQELVFIPLMLVLIQIFRSVIYHYYPDTAMFDRGSELETYLTRVWQITWITCGTWILLWVTFPPVHKALRNFYIGFDNLADAEKRSIALKFFFCFFFGLVFLMSGRAATETTIRKKLVDTITSQLHVREATGHNDGVDVEKYLAFVHQTKGASWCAAFTSYNLNAVGVTTPPNPRSAWSPAFAQNYIIWSPALQKQHKIKAPPKPGDCFTLYFENMGRVGHVGFIIGEDHGYFITIEGNTGTTGSREGSGVHKYKRLEQKVFAVTNYITPYINEKAISPFPIHIDANIMLPQGHAIIGEISRENQCFDNTSRYYYSSRYGIQIQRGQFKNCSFGNSGQRWASEYAGSGSGNATNEIRRINYKWKGERTLRLQRFGGKGWTSGKKDHGAYCNCTGKATREDRYQNSRSKIYPQVG